MPASTPHPTRPASALRPCPRHAFEARSTGLAPQDLRLIGLFLALLFAVTGAFASPAEPAPADAATRVALREAVRFSEDRALTLGDVARIDGPLAPALAGVEIAPRASALPREASGWRRLDVARVRSALEARRDLHLGRVELAGAAVLVGLPGDTPVAASSVRRRAPSGVATTPQDVHVHPALRGLIEQRVAALFGVPTSDLRLGFDPRDADALAMDPRGRVVEIRPTGMSDQLPLAIRSYEGDVAHERALIRVSVEVRRTVAVARREVRRGQPFRPDDVLFESRWTAPSVSALTPERLEGAVAVRSVRVGEVLAEADIDRPVAVRRGEIATVEALVGGIKIGTRARARAAGRVGDVIEFEFLDRSGRFTARVNGPRYAVMAEAPGPTPGPTPAKETR